MEIRSSSTNRKGGAMLILMANEGRSVCGPSCPFYEESGTIDCFGGKKNSHCRMIMQPYYVDCNRYDVSHLQIRNIAADELPETLSELQTAPLAKTRKLYKKNRKLRTLKSDGQIINRH